MSTATAESLTPEDLLRRSATGDYELVDGVLKERRMGAESDWVAAALTGFLLDHCREHGLGHVFGPTGYQCFPWRPNLVRKPDVTFVARGQLPNERPPLGHIRVRPDLAAEIVSPNDLSEEDVSEKVAEYFRAGVRLVWVVSPRTRVVHVLRPDGTAAWLTADRQLDGGDVLPGFSVRVADLFPTPEPEAPAA